MNSFPVLRVLTVTLLCAAIAFVFVLRLNDKNARPLHNVSLMGLPVTVDKTTTGTSSSSTVDTSGKSTSKFLDGFRSSSRLVKKKYQSFLYLHPATFWYSFVTLSLTCNFWYPIHSSVSHTLIYSSSSHTPIVTRYPFVTMMHWKPLDFSIHFEPNIKC